MSKDVTEEVRTEIVQPKVVRAEQQGENVLILAHVGSIRRFDGKTACYRLEHRWLSRTDDVHSVQGNDFTFWQKKELTALGALDENKSLFDCFQLFP